MKDIIEPLASKIHQIYQQESKRQNNVKYPDNYYELPEHIKDYDRVIARFILENYVLKKKYNTGEEE